MIRGHSQSRLTHYYIHLVYKLYVNRVSLSKDYIPYKSLGLWSPYRYGIDHSHEVLKIDFGQGAAKISEVKVGGKKKYMPCQLSLV